MSVEQCEEVKSWNAAKAVATSRIEKEAAEILPARRFAARTKLFVMAVQARARWRHGMPMQGVAHPNVTSATLRTTNSREATVAAAFRAAADRNN
jgi:hypothetical protein